MSQFTPLSPMVDRVVTRFMAEFPGESPTVFFAPGRVNLVGAHLDYSGGDVLPVAVDLGVYLAIRMRSDTRLRLRSLSQPDGVDATFDDIGATHDPNHRWATYPFGVVHTLAAQAGLRRCGFDAVYGGDLPMASGMSSSAAIEVVTAFALDALLGLGLGLREIAVLCHAAETNYVGVKCGIMDQFASALGRPGHALLLHCADASFEHVAIQGRGFQILVMDTRKPRALMNGAFNQRVAECADALAILQRELRKLDHLSDYSEADLDAVGPALVGVLRKRARHVVTEMGRIARGVAALRRGDCRALGRALTDSHRSTAEDYEVSCPELDAITAAACTSDAVFGARLTGAGFGGCAIALIEPGSADAVMDVVKTIYTAKFGVEPGFHLLAAGGGPRRIDIAL